METIKVRISYKGAIEYTVNGVKGKKCRELTTAIDQMSSEVISSEVTGEYCETEAAQENHIKGQS